jgi:3-oxoacyl-[acyl-carrier-protein] synthase-3
VTGAEIGIGAIRCLLPDERVKVADLPEFALLGHEEAEFARSSGVDTVAVFADEETTTGLAGRVCGELLAEHPEEPDLLLLVGPRSPEVLLGSDSAQVQDISGLRSAFAFTVDGLGCAGSSAAWGLARDLLLADPSRDSVLIAHASRPTGVDRIRYPVTVIGDGAFAMTMRRGGRPVLRAHRMETDGSFNDLFRVDYKKAPWYEWREECQSPDRYRFELAMHSQKRLDRLVDQVLADAGVTKARVAATLMQNVTSSAYGFYEALLDLPIHQVCGRHLSELGHLGAMDVVLNLHHLLAAADLKPGDLVLVLNNSPVAAWAVTLWEV